MHTKASIKFNTIILLFSLSFVSCREETSYSFIINNELDEEIVLEGFDMRVEEVLVQKNITPNTLELIYQDDLSRRRAPSPDDIFNDLALPQYFSVPIDSLCIKFSNGQKLCFKENTDNTFNLLNYNGANSGWTNNTYVISQAHKRAAR